MNGDLDAIKKMHQTEGAEKIDKIKKKIDTTKYNMEVSKEVMAETPSDAQQENLKDKNTNRQHAIASMQKEIRDIEQAMEQDS